MSCKTLGIRRMNGTSPWFGGVFLAGLLFSAAVCLAGDPIQFSGDKTRLGPQQERKVDSDIFKSFQKDAGQNPFSSLTPYFAPSRTEPRDAKRLKKEREERRNWLLTDPDDKEKENDIFGDDDAFSWDEFEDDEEFDATFAPLVRGKTPGKSRANANQRVFIRPEADEIRNERNDEEVVGAHTSRVMDLKNLLDTSQNTSGRGGVEPSLFEFLRDNTAAPRLSEDQIARKKQFESFLNAAPGDPMQPRMMDPINSAPDLTQQRMNPVLPGPGRNAWELPGGRPDFSAKPDYSRPAAQPFPTAPAANNRPSVLGSGSLFNNQIQRRPGT